MTLHYRLGCLGCGKVHDEADTGFLLGCDQEHPPALLRADYASHELAYRDSEPGIFRYRDWLPIRRPLPKASRPAVYRSEKMAARLGLENLWVAFNGYWPERGAAMEACTFKELEALPICARIPDGEQRTLVVSSAGNTGRAFLQVGSANGIRVLVVVPEFALPQMWLTGERHPNVHLAVLKGDTDYLDAIELGATISGFEEFFPEGGARNVARRDGMGTVVLAAAEEIGGIPAHYFQAIGSGTGGIAAWEMTLRLLADGRFGTRRMKLHLSQSDPFTPMSDAWESGSRAIAEMDEEDARRRISAVHSPVLTNRKPPYAIVGGVYDALVDTAGHMYAVDGATAREAGALFESLEGSDLDPAAEVALRSLMQAVEGGRVDRGDLVLLNATGGGQKRMEREGRKRQLAADIEIGRDEMDPRTVRRKLERIIAGG